MKPNFSQGNASCQTSSLFSAHERKAFPAHGGAMQPMTTLPFGGAALCLLKASMAPGQCGDPESTTRRWKSSLLWTGEENAPLGATLPLWPRRDAFPASRARYCSSGVQHGSSDATSGGAGIAIRSFLCSYRSETSHSTLAAIVAFVSIGGMQMSNQQERSNPGPKVPLSCIPEQLCIGPDLTPLSYEECPDRRNPHRYRFGGVCPGDHFMARWYRQQVVVELCRTHKAAQVIKTCNTYPLARWWVTNGKQAKGLILEELGNFSKRDEEESSANM